MNKNISQALKRAAPTILSILAGVGLIGTTALAIKATPKAAKKLDAEIKKRCRLEDSETLVEKKDGEYGLSVKETVKVTWRCYVPTIVTGGATLACIIGSNVLNGKEVASLSSAYALIRESYEQYRDKVKELYGEEAHKKVLESIAVEHARDTYLHCEAGFQDTALDIGEDNPEEKILFYDSYGGRYFEKTLSSVIEAEYHLNRNFSLGGCVTLKDLYDFLGLNPIEGSDKVGWTGEDGIMWIDFNHNLVTLDDGLECVIIDMAYLPEEIEEW